MKKIFYLNSLVFVLFTLCHCSGGTTNIYANTTQVAVDSTNDRLFVAESSNSLFTLTASTKTALGGDQPIVTSTVNNTIYDLLPSVITHITALAEDTTTRLFISGTFADDSGNLVSNRVRVIDFDGTTFTEADFSPVILSDGDGATDETDDSFSDMIADTTNNTIYITDTSTGLLLAINAADGTEFHTPLAIAGAPQGLAIDNNYLYVCNTSTVTSEQLVTVVKIADFTTTTIDLDIPCRQIAAGTNASGTVLMVKNSSTQQVLIRLVDTATYAASTAVATTTTDFTNGELLAGFGISSGVNDIVLAKDSTGLLQAYLPQQDGNIEFITFTSDLTSFSAQTLAAVAQNIFSGAVLQNSDGTGATIFFPAESGYLIWVDVGSTSVELKN